jgi:hypothetical protein
MRELRLNADQVLILQRAARRLGSVLLKDVDYIDDPEQVDDLVERGMGRIEARKGADGHASWLEWFFVLADSGYDAAERLRRAGLLRVATR